MRCRRGYINRGINLGLLACLGVTFAASAADAPSVHVYNWYDYIGPTTLADFKRDSGISRFTTPSTVPKCSKANC